MACAAQQIQVNGTDLNVIIEGQGPDILLVHGFPDCHDLWRHQLPVLTAAGYRVIAPDTRGCGDSSVCSAVSEYDVSNLVADLAGLLDVLDIQQVYLVGHDWGAVICWQFMLRHPGRVRRYVAISVGHPSAYADAGIVQKIKGYYIVLLLMKGLAEVLVRQCNWLPLRLMTRYPEEFPRWRARLSRPGRFTAGANYYRANLKMLRRTACPRLTVPVLGIWSSGDIFLTEAQMTNSRQYVGGPWTYARIDGANHWIPLSAPDQLNRLLLDYLADDVVPG